MLNQNDRIMNAQEARRKYYKEVAEFDASEHLHEVNHLFPYINEAIELLKRSCIIPRGEVTDRHESILMSLGYKIDVHRKPYSNISNVKVTW